jgi:hypothetical protein
MICSYIKSIHPYLYIFASLSDGTSVKLQFYHEFKKKMVKTKQRERKKNQVFFILFFKDDFRGDRRGVQMG